MNLHLDTISHLKLSDPSVLRIYLVRHGESTVNQLEAKGIKFVSGSSPLLPLSFLGQEQAESLGQKLAQKVPKGAEIVIAASSAQRSIATADVLFAAFKGEKKVQRVGNYPGLIELSQGHWEGTPKNSAYERALQPWEDSSAEQKYVIPKVEGAESYRHVATRVLATLQKITAAREQETFFVVSHYVAINAVAIQLSHHTLSQDAHTPLPMLRIHNGDLLLLEVPRGHSVAEAIVKEHLIFATASESSIPL